MPTFQGKRVSRSWKPILVAYENGPNRHIQLNSGRRTLSEQWALYRAYQRGSGVVAAYPNPNAPHIRAGREDHALDLDTRAGDGEQDFQNWLARQGVASHNPVPGEAWHLEVLSERALIKLGNKLRRRQRLKAEAAKLTRIIKRRFGGKWRRSPKRRARYLAIKRALRRNH